jgi:F0F1-type ATP synthase assembly protein I
MSKIDEIKENIGWLKIIFGLLTAVDVSLLGWLAQNYKIAEPLIIIMTLLLIIVSTAGIIVINKKAYKKIRELGDL